MKKKISYAPFIVILALIATYFFVKVLDFSIDKYLLPRFNTESGDTKITKRHFVQPDENVFQPKYFKMFLENVTKNKSGILASKLFYVVLIVLYLGLSITVFLMLFPIRKSVKNNRKDCKVTGKER